MEPILCKLPLQHYKINCLNSVLPGKLEVIVLITVIKSEETDSPAHKAGNLNCDFDLESKATKYFLIGLLLYKQSDLEICCFVHAFCIKIHCNLI